MDLLSSLVCPRTHAPLSLDPCGDLVSALGERYPVVDGIPELLLAQGHQQASAQSQDLYRLKAAEYDRGAEVMFAMLRAEEKPTRDAMIALLRLQPGARVLEIGCGTCRDTIHLLENAGEVVACDLAREMVLVGRERMRGAEADFSRLGLLVADGMSLPFPAASFDAVYHFGGLNLFPDIAGALREMCRVVKPGGRVVAGDEGCGAWLSGTQFAKILQNSNPLFLHQAPISQIPVAARDVACHWVLNGSFYVLSFSVGEGEPELDIDVQFPGWRGGSHRSRYFGKLEGVDPGIKDRIVKAAANEGLSIVSWLERALLKELKERDR